MRPPLFHRVLGGDLSKVPPPVAAIHDIGTGRTWRGAATVTAGSTVLARLVCALTGFPPPADTTPLTVEMKPDGEGEVWRRWFGDFLLRSRITVGPAPHTIEETMSAVTVQLRLVADEAGVQQVPERVSLRGVPLPRLIWPTLEVREGADGVNYAFEVSMHLWGALLLRYEGHLEPPAENETTVNHGI